MDFAEYVPLITENQLANVKSEKAIKSQLDKRLLKVYFLKREEFDASILCHEQTVYYASIKHIALILRNYYTKGRPSKFAYLKHQDT